MKRWIACLLMLPFILALAGCWNYKEIDKFSIVAGIAIDRDPANGDFILYIEIIESSQVSKEKSHESKIVEIRGKTIFDAVRSSINVSGQRMFWSHAQIIIVSEAVARQGILNVVDWFYRDA